MSAMFAAVIPTVNEAATVGALVNVLEKFCDRVVVSDGSPNNETANVVAHSGAVLIDGLGGLGPAYQRAWQVIPVDWYVGHIDAGGSHDPQDLADMLDIATTGYDCVIGSRFGVGGEHLGSWHRRVTSRLASHAMNMTSKIKVDDWTSGLRVYSPLARKLLTAHTFITTGHAWQIESLKVLTDARVKIIECPITYTPSGSHLNAHRVGEAARYWWKCAATDMLRELN